MKPHLLTVALGLLASAGLAKESSVLLMERTDAHSLTTAIVKSAEGETRITAAGITCDQSGHVIRCTGDTEITTAGRSVRGKDMTFAFPSEETVTVYRLNPNGITVTPKPTGFEVNELREHPLRTRL